MMIKYIGLLRGFDYQQLNTPGDGEGAETPPASPPATPPAETPPASPPATPPAETPPASPPATPPAETPPASPPATPPADSKPWLENFDGEARVFLDGKGFSKIENTTEAMAAIVKQAQSLEKMVGSDTITLPGAEQVKEWEGWAKLGVPDTVEGYKLERPKLPDGLPYDEALETKMLAVALEEKALPSQMQAMMKVFAEHQIGELTALEATVAADKIKTEQTLKADWGGDFDKNFNLAQNAMAFFEKEGLLDDSLIELIKEKGGQPKLIKFLADIGGRMGEDLTISGGVLPFGNSPAGAQAQLNELKNDPAFQKSLNDKKDPGHKAAVERHTTLFKLMSEGKKIVV